MYGAAAMADQTDARLEKLFEQLRDSPDANTADQLEREIWIVWLDSGREDVDHLMFRGIRAMHQRQMRRAFSLFDRVVEIAPKYAEGWNKRATVLYLQDRLAESMADIERTLQLEPRHFGALSGMGLIFVQVEDEEGAMRAFEAVLELNPHSSSAIANIDQLRAKVQGEAL
jgi:tetratricopeptide (TPR) repeat protein